MKVLILYSLPPQSVPIGRSQCEFDLSEGVQSIADVLGGSTLAGVQGQPREILDVLSQHQPDVVFNACEAPLGRADLEPQVVALLEWAGVPFTGSGSETLALCRRKDRTSAVLSAAGIAVPRTGIFPCIVKPAAEDGSAGIDMNSICHNPSEVERAAARISGPVVVEEFLCGREFVVSLWGHCGPEHFSVGEIRFRGDLRLTSYAAKWDPASQDFANSPMVYDKGLEPPLREAILKTAREAWAALGLKGYGRVDVRLNSEGIPCVLDVNPNPDLAPGGGIHRAVVEAGWTWEHFIRKQVEWALSSANS